MGMEKLQGKYRVGKKGVGKTSPREREIGNKHKLHGRNEKHYQR